MRTSLEVKEVVGFSNLLEKGKTNNCVVQSASISERGVIFPLKDTLRFYNGVRSKEILKVKKCISSIAIQGPYFAVGEKGMIGELVSSYFFDIYNLEKVQQFRYQKTSIRKMAISNNGAFLCSVGDSDVQTQDFVVIDTRQCTKLTTKIFHRRSIRNKRKIVDVIFSHTDPLFFALVFPQKLYFVRILEETGEIQEILVKEHKVREFSHFTFDQNDKICYISGRNGDVTEIDVKKQKELRVGPMKRVVVSGIKLLKILDSEHMLIIGFKGLICLMQKKTLKIIREVTLKEEILAVTDFVDGIAFVATENTTIYKLMAQGLEASIYYISMPSKINEISYCESNINSFVTCSDSSIFIWNCHSMVPQLRIKLPKIVCHSIAVDKYGKFIVSAWSDGSVRLFLCFDGKLVKKLENCHLSAVTKVIMDSNQTKILTGSEEGEIRVWNMSEAKLGAALGFMSFHSKRINQLKINTEKHDELMAVSEDGKYSIWNLEHFELIYCYQTCSFIKDCFFEDSFTVSLFGSGSYRYQVIKANGEIIKKHPLSSSHINSTFVYQSLLGSRMLLYGGEQPYLFLEDISLHEVPTKLLYTFSEISTVKLLPDQQTIILGTVDGLLLKVALKEEKIILIKEEEDKKILSSLHRQPKQQA